MKSANEKAVVSVVSELGRKIDSADERCEYYLETALFELLLI